MTIIAVPKILRDKLTDAGADALVQLIDRIEERAQLAVLELSEERFEKRLLQVDSRIEKSAAELDAKIEKSAAELDAKIEKSAAELDAKIEKSVTELDAKIDKSVATLDAKIDTTAAKTDAKIEKIRADLIQWMLIFWAGQVGTITAILFAFFKP